jgi:hypothetical protein
MTTFSWLNDASGDWDNGTNWKPIGIPGSSTAQRLNPANIIQNLTVWMLLVSGGTLDATGTVTVTHGLLSALNGAAVQPGSPPVQAVPHNPLFVSGGVFRPRPESKKTGDTNATAPTQYRITGAISI